MFDKVKRFLGIKLQPSMSVVTIGPGASVDPGELPVGFFRVQLDSGRESLGYNDPPREYTGPSVEDPEKIVTRMSTSPFGVCWDVGTTVNVGGRRVTLDVPIEELPVVRLRGASRGTVLPNGSRIIDTNEGGFDGAFEYAPYDPAGRAGQR